MRFTFLESTEARLLGILQELFPGAKRFMCLSELAQKQGYKIHFVDGSVQNINDHRGAIAALFNSRDNFRWFTEKELPFEQSHGEKAEPLDLFGELQGNVMSLILSIKDVRYLLIVFLNHNLGHFKPARKQDFFTPDNRSIIAYLTLQSIRKSLEEDNNNNSIFQGLKDQMRQLGQIQQSKEQDSNIQYIERINLEYAGAYLNQHGQNQSYILSPAARDKVKDFRGSLKNLNLAMERAALMANNLSKPNDRGELVIEDWYLIAENNKPAEEAEKASSVLEEKYIKTYQLLERLEQAASQIHQNSMALTGSNIGKFMSKPISAPAISDALKQHKQRICFLFDRFPDRWATIRNHFRPVQNLFNDLREDLERSA